MRALAALMMAVLLAGCSSRNEHGECIGIGDEKKPDLIYKVSVRNVVVGILFFEMIVPPVIVAVDEFYCPVGKK